MDLIIRGQVGRIEAAYQKNPQPAAPVVLVMPDAPNVSGANMNDKLTYTLFHSFVNEGFHTLRMNFRSVGRSEGEFTGGEGELADAGCILDWIQKNHEYSENIWVAGVGFGAYIGMQLLMRRPEITTFITVNPPLADFDFSFLSPCPCNGLILNSAGDTNENHNLRKALADKINEQKDVKVKYVSLKDTTPAFENRLPLLFKTLREYIATQKDKENKLI